MSEMTHRVTIRVPKAEMPQLRKRAREAGFSELSEYIRIRVGIKAEDGRRSRSTRKAK